MIECASCHNEVPDDANFCTSCGRRVPRCESCGVVALAGARFCGECGAELKGEDAAQVADPAELELELEAEFARARLGGGVGILYRLDRPASRGIVGRGDTKVGAGPRNDVTLDEPAISWNHALISWRDGALVLRDTASTNGTFLNGERVRAPRSLAHGDTITFATTRMRLWLAPKLRL